MITILKLIISVGLIVWLITTGKLDFSIFLKVLGNPLIVFTCMSIFILDIILVTIRWRALLHTKTDKKLPFLSILRINWIGLLFSTVALGIIGGDIVKLVQARNLDKEKFSKTFLATSVFVDRLFGLFGLLIILGIASAIFYNEVHNFSPNVAKLLYTNFLLALMMIFIFTTIFLPARLQNYLKTLFAKIPFIAKPVINIFEQVWAIGRHRKTFLLSIILSIFVHFMNIFVIWLLATQFVQTELPIAYTFLFVPLGFLIAALPISPAGLGVGHAAFDTLFSYFNVSNGASIFNIYFLFIMFIYLIGIFPYLKTPKISKEAQLSLNEK